MKWILVGLFFMMYIHSLSAFEFSEVWSKSNQLFLQIDCNGDEAFCNEICQQKNQCQIVQSECRDCIGTNILITNIFEQMGTLYRNSGIKLDFMAVQNFITKKPFVSFTSKSIFNQIDSYDSPALRMRFQSLCPNNVDYPVVLFEINPKSHKIKNTSMVVCLDEIYQMSSEPEIRKIDTGLELIF